MAYLTVDLDQFDDEDIREEYESRGLGSTELEPLSSVLSAIKRRQELALDLNIEIKELLDLLKTTDL
jgi:hypothetical protein